MVPPRVPGWKVAAATNRNAAYDVPPAWQVQASSLYRGFTAGEQEVQMGGLAWLPSCSGADDRPHWPAWAGVYGSPRDDTAVAAQETGATWAGWFGPGSVGRPGPATPVTIADGTPATHVVTEVEVPSPAPCGSRRAVLHTVAAPARNGTSVVWVLLADLDVPTTPTDADIATMISTLRDPGLAPGCDGVEPVVVGRWC